MYSLEQDPRQLFTFKAAADILGLTPNALYAVEARGAIKPVIIAARKMMRREDLVRLLREGDGHPLGKRGHHMKRRAMADA